MRAARVILATLLLVAGCATRSKESAIAEKHADEGNSSSALNGRLCQVAAEGDLDSVRAHLAAGACVNARDEGEATPLHRAVASGHREVVEFLIAHGANVNAVGGILAGTPLCEAVATDYSLVAGDLLKKERPDLGYDDKLYWELREKLAKQLMLDIVRILIEHGADVNARDESGGTVLFFALGDNTPVEVIKFLLTRGAHPGLKDDYGTTVLHEAAAEGLTDLVALFLDSGTDVDLRDADRQAPLHEAVWQDNKEMVELLLARGADVSARDKNGDTPLHIAAMNGYGPLFDLLVSRGADPKAKNKQRLTPVACARSAPPQKMIRLTPEGAWPYSVIITRMSSIRRFLQVRRIAYDRICIPREVDIKRAEAILKHVRDGGGAGRGKETSKPEPVAIDLGRDNREYAGFTRGKEKFVVCNMNNHGPDMPPAENQLSGPGFDEWGAFKLAVIALDTERVEWIESEYF
jgi:ankyrin repeat protein